MISDTMPKAGRIMMYTSGCPKIQNRCSHSSGSAPCCTLKKLAPNSRSNISRNWADGEHRHGEQQQELRDQAHPGEHRHLHQRHARRPHVEHGDDQVDRRRSARRCR